VRYSSRISIIVPAESEVNLLNARLSRFLFVYFRRLKAGRSDKTESANSVNGVRLGESMTIATKM